MLTLFGKIAEHLLGHKYYCVTLDEVLVPNKNGDTKKSMSGYIFRDKESAKEYFYQMKSTKKFKSVEIVSFRSREKYEPFNNDYLI